MSDNTQAVEPKEQEAQAVTEAPKASTRKVLLDHSITINGNRFPVGEVTIADIIRIMRDEDGNPLVDEEKAETVADDLQQINARQNRYLVNLNKKHTLNHDFGSVAVGSGS